MTKFYSILFLFIASCLYLFCTSNQPKNNETVWKHLSSAFGDLEVPNPGNQQTATAVFDVDKNDVMHKYGAAWVFGNYLGQEGWGIRIGTIGEAYAGYGVYYGVCLQMFLFGIIFGVLERIYLNLNKKDARLGFVCFLMSLFMYLPLSTLVVTTTNLLFFGFFFILYQIIGTNQVAIWLKK